MEEHSCLVHSSQEADKERKGLRGIAPGPHLLQPSLSPNSTLSHDLINGSVIRDPAVFTKPHLWTREPLGERFRSKPQVCWPGVS